MLVLFYVFIFFFGNHLNRETAQKCVLDKINI